MLRANNNKSKQCQRTNNNEILLEPKVNVTGHQISPMLLGNGVNLLSVRQTGACIWDTKSEIKRLINNAFC